MRDGASGRSRGFGFLTFKDARTVNVVMVKEHYLDGKIIDPKRAIPRDEQERTSKIFVGGVSQEASEGDFKEYFMQFGRVVDATLMMDKDTGRPRGFGFVTFDSEEAVERCLSMPLEILGKAIEVKKAQPRGNVRDEEGPGHGGGAKFRGNDHSNFNNNPNQQAMGGMGGMAGMTPQIMAQYWQRMQQYMAMMQQQQMQMQRGGGGMGGMGQMNPMMMQQFQAMQAAQQQGGMGGMSGGRSMSPGGMSGGMGQMNPMMMQQMMQQQQMQNQGQMSPSGPQSAMSPISQHQGMANQRGPSPALSARAPSQQPTYSAYEQQQFEQQKYEAQAQQSAPQGPGHHGGGGKKRQASQQPQPQIPGGPAPKFGQPTSWEGMYDDVPQPGQPNKKQRNSATPVAPNPNAPVGAPTGPKNAGKPGANYRGGGRGSRGGFHPYSR